MRGVLVAVFLLTGVLSWLSFESSAADPSDYTPEEQAWLDDHKVVRVMVGTWPPFHSMKDGKPTGLAFDYATFILNDLGLEVEPVPILWHDALKGSAALDPGADVTAGRRGRPGLTQRRRQRCPWGEPHCARNWSRSAPTLSAMAGTSRSNWPRNSTARRNR